MIWWNVVARKLLWVYIIDDEGVIYQTCAIGKFGESGNTKERKQNIES